jgi:hypothetical protein
MASTPPPDLRQPTREARTGRGDRGQLGNKWWTLVAVGLGTFMLLLDTSTPPFSITGQFSTLPAGLTGRSSPGWSACWCGRSGWTSWYRHAESGRCWLRAS